MPTFLSARPNLYVSDVAASIAFYRDALGFDAPHTLGDPPTFALLTKDGAEIALIAAGRFTPSGCYIYATGVRELHDRLQAAAARIVHPLTPQPWGLLDFVVRDPDGNEIAIGERQGE